MGDWLKNNPIGGLLVNISLCIIIAMLLIRIYINKRIDSRIINEYQKPIVEKLDTLINYYEYGNGDRNKTD